MRIPRVYLRQAIQDNTELTLDSDASHYLIKVLRMAKGRTLIAFDGSGKQWPAEITSDNKKNATIHTDLGSMTETESPLSLHLAIGISRGDRFDWVIQKATELGVTQITPLLTERCEIKLRGERLQKKTEQWQQIAISACEQSQRNIVPAINMAITLDAFYTAYPAIKNGFVLHHRSNRAISEYTDIKESTLLIGPEGGLTDTEITTAINHNLEPLTLGPRVLRTETAPLAAIAILQHRFGDI